jgi:2-desacetyl-2-hydroxyethyl bacteriochlorophyllide A dehydrogenase
MKAVRFHGVGDLRVDEVPAPSPGAGEVLIEPLAVGVCGTDTHIMDGHYPARPPVILGHEVSGRVVELGTGATGLSIGDLVTVEPHRYCGACTYCRRGMEHMCLRKEAYGVHLDGGMAELMVAPARIAYRLPASIDPAIAALTEPLSCCVHGMDRLGTASGLPILIFGCGPAGAILIALARQSGLHPVVAADKREDRRDLARRMGADVVLDPAADDFDQQVRSVTDGEGYPYLIDAVGASAVLEQCVRLSARGGRILVFGVASPHARATVRPNEIYTKELTILGTAINPFTHLRAAGLLERLPLHEIRIASFPLDKAEEAVTAVRSGLNDKIQLIPSSASGR